MGVLAIIVGGFVGIVLACKKTFLESWIFLVNLAFATYLAIFMAPLILPFLKQFSFAQELKVGGVIMVLTFCLAWVLNKITEQIAPESGLDITIPPLADKITNMATGFLSGMLLVALVLFMAVKLPFMSSVSCRNDLQKSSRSVLLKNIKVLNALSRQTISSKGKIALQQMLIIPAPPSKKMDSKPQKVDQVEAVKISDKKISTTKTAPAADALKAKKQGIDKVKRSKKRHHKKKPAIIIYDLPEAVSTERSTAQPTSPPQKAKPKDLSAPKMTNTSEPNSADRTVAEPVTESNKAIKEELPVVNKADSLKVKTEKRPAKGGSELPPINQVNDHKKTEKSPVGFSMSLDGL